MSAERKRIPGWILVLAMAAFIAGMGIAIYFSVRPDPSLPRPVVEKR
jgi:hypothetical protein